MTPSQARDARQERHELQQELGHSEEENRALRASLEDERATVEQLQEVLRIIRSMAEDGTMMHDAAPEVCGDIVATVRDALECNAKEARNG